MHRKLPEVITYLQYNIVYQYLSLKQQQGLKNEIAYEL